MSNNEGIPTKEEDDFDMKMPKEEE